MAQVGQRPPETVKQAEVFIHAFPLWVHAVALVAAVFAVYWPVLGGEFVWDDPLLVERNPLVTGSFNLLTLWFQTDFPLTNVVLWLQWLAWGKSAAGYHVVNVALHAVNVVLVWRLFRQMRFGGAWLAALLFAVHPVCVGSVAWISEQKNTLSLAFFLLSLLAWLRWRDENVTARESTGGEPESSAANGSTRISAQPRRRLPRWAWYALAFVAFLLALLAKTSTVMLPVVLLAFDWWRKNRVGRAARVGWLLAPVLPFFILAVAFGLQTVWFQKHQVILQATVQTENFWGRLAGAGWAIVFYLGKAFLPINLNAIYPRWVIDPSAFRSWLPTLLLILGAAGCWAARRTWGRPVFLAVFCFAVTLFPALGFFDMYYLAISRVSDHFQYLSIPAVLGLAAAGLSPIRNRPAGRLGPGSAAWAGVSVVIILACAVLSFQRAQVYSTDEGLWRDTLAKNPGAWTAHNNLGCIAAEKQDLDAAMLHFRQSLEINPRNAPAHANLGRALALRGRLEEARAHLATALELKPDADTRFEYAYVLIRVGQTGAGARELRQVLAAQPNSVDALNNLAWVLATCPDPTVRNGAEALGYAEKACRLTQNRQPTMLTTLSAAYAETGRFSEALAAAEKAAGLATQLGDARLAAVNRQLAAAYRAGQPWREQR